MAGRNEEKGKAAIEKLKKEGLEPGNGDVVWLELELSDPRKAKSAAEEFRKVEKRLDVLGEYPFHFLCALVDCACGRISE